MEHSPSEFRSPKSLERLSGSTVAILVAWFGLVLYFFASHQTHRLGPISDLLKTLGFVALSVYSFHFLGWRLLRHLGVSVSIGLESLAYEIALGTGAFIAAMFIAGTLGWYQDWLPWLLLAGAMIGPHPRYWQEMRARKCSSEETRGSGSLLIPLCLFATAGMTLLASWAPAISQDALVYHLAVPAQYIEKGFIHHVNGNFYSAFPMNVEMLFTFGLLLDGESLAKWFHWMFGAASAIAVAALSLRLCLAAGCRPGTSALLSSALFVTIPTAALISGWAYVDLAVVFFGSVSTLAILRYLEEDSNVRFVSLSAICAGCAAGCKYTAGAQAILTVLAMLIWRKKNSPWARRALHIGVYSALVAVVVAPWYLKNIIFVGNPLYPFAYSIFGGEAWDESRAAVLSQSLREWGGSKSGLDLLSLPWRVSVSAEFFSQKQFDGVIGAAFLMGAPLLWFARRGSMVYRIAGFMFLGNFAFWALTTHQVRFLLPALAIQAAMMPAALQGLSSRWISVPQLALRAAVVLNVVIIAVHFAGHRPLSVVLGYESEDSYLERSVPGGDYAVFRHIREKLPLESRILFASLGNPGFLCKRPYYADALFENFTLAQILGESRSPADVLKKLRKDGFSHVIFRFDTVFDPSGRKSEIPVASQQLFSRFLNECAELEFQRDLTFLYRLNDASASLTEAVK